jgi:UDP-N-acetylglucosamine--N-acetylmuramyl-(pentapeptide) pyrophosphoryl-undecaprenol N-acetylglucosamine transferase
VSREFRARRPAAVLAMGGFTSAAPILAGRRVGAATFLHEANSIPGRANRWLARWVDRAFVGFPQTAARLRHCRITVTGTPVRARFGAVDGGFAGGSLGWSRTIRCCW